MTTPTRLDHRALKAGASVTLMFSIPPTLIARFVLDTQKLQCLDTTSDLDGSCGIHHRRRRCGTTANSPDSTAARSHSVDRLIFTGAGRARLCKNSPAQ